MTQIINFIITVIWWFYTIPSHYDVERRSSVKYMKKKAIVKDVWIGSLSIIAILLNILPIAMAAAVCTMISLTTTFIGFMILDETE